MKITDFGYNGEGVGHVNGKVCFVPYTLQGEEVEAEKLRETSSVLHARVKAITTSSPLRKKAPCPYFATCGGCDFQHMSYEEEIKLKLKILSRHFVKLGYKEKIDAFISPNEYGYRNKIRLFCDKNGLGLKKSQSNFVVSIDRCLLAREKIDELIPKLQDFVKSMKLTHDIENVVLREQEGQVLVWFIFNKKIDVNFSWLSYLLGENVSIFQSVKGEKPRCVLGKDKFYVKELGLDCEYSVDGFHQVNDEVYIELYNKVLSTIRGGVVLNAYSGGGVLSGAIAKNVKEVYGVELGESEHASAQKLKEKNQLENLTNIQGDCVQILPQLDKKFDYVVLDPPRSGCMKKVMESVNALKAKQIIYISCNPSTLVRDLALLSNYEIEKVHLFDMFPRTANFETLTILKLI